ncbi:MAG: NAD(P)/FAD-dependent oxidoreductase [bacterium]
MPDFEITIVGAGVVGLAIAARLSEHHPSILLVEKNEKYGLETSSRNSEVIHAGIYYVPGSLKATLCVEGRDELYSLCSNNPITYRQYTKLITATDDHELAKLEKLYRNGCANGVQLEMLDRKATLNLEPNIQTVGSIYSPLTGIINVHDLMDYYFHQATSRGLTVQHRCEVVGLEQVSGGFAVTIDEQGNRSSFTTEKVINAAGLYSDHIASLIGINIDAAGYRLAHAKGSYFAVSSSKAKLVSRLVYPAPHEESLGVHVVLDLVGRLRFGPDMEYLPYRTFDYSVDESKKKAFSESVRHILPAIDDDDLTPDICGIRPRLQRPGEPVRDFVIVHEKERGLEGFINLIGIESPGLTASPAIARYVEGLLI